MQISYEIVSEAIIRDGDRRRFPFRENFGKFVLGISVWEERVPFVTSYIRSQAPLCRLTKRPGAHFSKLPIITGPVKVFCFPFQMRVSEGLIIVQ